MTEAEAHKSLEEALRMQAQREQRIQSWRDARLQKQRDLVQAAKTVPAALAEKRRLVDEARGEERVLAVKRWRNAFVDLMSLWRELHGEDLISGDRRLAIISLDDASFALLYQKQLAAIAAWQEAKRIAEVDALLAPDRKPS